MIARPNVWVTKLATCFWESVGEPAAFPRDLRAAVCWLQTLHVVDVPNLTLATAAATFARHGIPCRTPTEDRPLAGCFGGHHGIGVIVLDSTLEADELRFTLAHEIAHYLRDYDQPRRMATHRLGSGVLEVLDGVRPPTGNERLAGVLRNIPLGCHLHFLDRDRWGRTISAEAHAAEEAADRLAYELLAPFDAVKPKATPDRAALAFRLTSDFGLPPSQAAKYAAILIC